MLKSISIAVLALVGFAAAAHACDCARPESAAAQVDGATVAFVGTAKTTVHSDEDGPPSVTTIFTVKEMLKGAPASEITLVHAPILGANCGVDFKDGEDALVLAYAASADAPLETNGCSMPQFPEAEIRAAAKAKTKDAP